MSMSEHDIQNTIRLELAKRGIPCFRVNVGKIRMKDGRWFDTGVPKGFSDLFGFLPDGQIFFIEVKNDKGRVREEQARFMELMREKGAVAGVCRSFEDVERLIAKESGEQ